MKSTTILAVAIGIGLASSAASAAPKSKKTKAQTSMTSDARSATRRLNEQQLAMAQGGVAGMPASSTPNGSIPGSSMQGNPMQGNAMQGAMLPSSPGATAAPTTNGTMTPPINPNDSGVATTPSQMDPSPSMTRDPATGRPDSTMGQMDRCQMNDQTGTPNVPPRR